MGNSFKSTLLALLRDVIIFVPASVILAIVSHSIVTMLWAAVISDVISATIGIIFMRSAIKEISKAETGKAIEVSDPAIEKASGRRRNRRKASYCLTAGKHLK